MTYREGSFSVGTAGGPTFIEVIEQDMLATGWERVSEGVVSGAATWNVYKSPAAANVLGKDFHVGLGYVTASKNSLLTCVFRAWDPDTLLASGIPPFRADSADLVAFDGYEAVQPPRALPDPDNQSPSRFEWRYSTNGYGPPNNRRDFIAGTGTNGTIPPVPNNGAMAFGGAVNAVPDLTIGIDSLTIVTGGTGYTSPPTLTITGGGATKQAKGTVTISGGAVTGVTMTDFGEGYTSQPTISFSGGGGSGATAEARGVWSTATNWCFVLRGFTAGNRPTDITKATWNTLPWVSGSFPTSSSQYRWAPSPGFNFRQVSLGSAGLEYWYSVTIDRVVYGLRVAGTTSDAYYMGIYDSMLTSIDDPYPVAMVYLTQTVNSSGHAPTPYSTVDGFGWSVIEPKVTGADRRHWACNLPAYQQLAVSNSYTSPRCLLTPAFGGNGSHQRDGYTGRPPVVRAMLMGRASQGFGYGDLPWIRGMLRGVYASNANAWTDSWLDEISWAEGGELKRAVRAGWWVWAAKE